MYLWGEQDLILDPLQGNLNSEEVKATEALVKVSPQNEVAVLTENYESHPVILEAGTMLGTLPQVQTVNDEKLPKVLSKELDSLSLSENSKAELLEPSSWKQQVMKQLDVEWCNTSAEEMAKLTALIEEFADVFALNAMEVGHTNLVQHHINTADHVPVKQASRRVPFSLRAKVEEMVKEMLDHGIIEHSTSPWASPIVLVSKHDGSTRFCVDYRCLNAITKLDESPLPRIDDSLDLLSGMKYFSTLDLATGYWQVGMSQDSKEKTAFVTHEGLYEFTVMPFGLCNAPATFQRLMEVTLRGLARCKCVVYLDDILVIGQSFKEHMDNLREVLDRLRTAGL